MSFSYTSSQRKGILFLLFIVGFIALYKLIHNSVTKNQKILPIEFMKINNKEPIENDFLKSNKKLDENPNTWTHNDWESIGLSEKQIKTVENYKNKLGGFKSKNNYLIVMYLMIFTKNYWIHLLSLKIN